MANVSFHLGTSSPGTSGLTAGGIYVNSSAGGIYYASSAKARSEIASKVEVIPASIAGGIQIGTITVNGTSHVLYCTGKGPYTTTPNNLYSIATAYAAGASIIWCRVTFNSDGLYPFMGGISSQGRKVIQPYVEFPMFRMVSSTSGTKYIGSFTAINGYGVPFVCDLTYADSSWTFTSYTYDDGTSKTQTITSTATLYSTCVGLIKIYNYSRF